MTETINILSISRSSDDTNVDIATKVKFTLSLEKDGNTVSDDFDILLASPYLIEGNQFTPYGDITESQIISWIKMSPEFLSKIGKLEFKLWDQQQTEDTTLPWNN
jgi:hypothetical protein